MWGFFLLCCLQAQEEFEVVHYPSPVLVHQDHSSHHQTLHQVGVSSGFQLAMLANGFLKILLIFPLVPP